MNKKILISIAIATILILGFVFFIFLFSSGCNDCGTSVEITRQDRKFNEQALKLDDPTFCSKISDKARIEGTIAGTLSFKRLCYTDLMDQLSRELQGGKKDLATTLSICDKIVGDSSWQEFWQKGCTESTIRPYINIKIKNASPDWRFKNGYFFNETFELNVENRLPFQIWYPKGCSEQLPQLRIANWKRTYNSTCGEITSAEKIDAQSSKTFIVNLEHLKNKMVPDNYILSFVYNIKEPSARPIYPYSARLENVGIGIKPIDQNICPDSQYYDENIVYENGTVVCKFR